MSKTLAAAFALATLVTAAAQAEAVDRATLRKYCTGDYLTYCGNLSPDGPEVQACFKANHAKLSQNCQGAIAAYTQGQKAAKADAKFTTR